MLQFWRKLPWTFPQRQGSFPVVSTSLIVYIFQLNTSSISFTFLYFYKKSSVSSAISVYVGVMVWVRNVLHSLGNLNTWSSVDGTVWEDFGHAAMLEEVCHWGQCLKLNPPAALRSPFLLVIQNVSSQLLFPPLSLPIWPCLPAMMESYPLGP